jgi:hypothetical protein
MKKINKNVFADIMNGILDSGQKEIVEKYPELVKSLTDIMDKSAEDFHLDFYYPIDGVIRNQIAQKLNKPAYDKAVSSVVFIYTNYTFVEENLKKFISMKEGMACEADKSRWLVNSLVKYYATGKEIDMTIDEKCYWKPHFWTAEQWIGLFESIKHMYYGNFMEYMKFIKDNWLPLKIFEEGYKNEVAKKDSSKTEEVQTTSKN